MSTQQPLLDWFQASQLLSVNERALKKMVREKTVPHILLPSGDVRFEVSDLNAWIAARKQTEAAR